MNIGLPELGIVLIVVAPVVVVVAAVVFLALAARNRGAGRDASGGPTGPWGPPPGA